MRKLRSIYFIFALPLFFLLFVSVISVGQENKNYTIQLKNGAFTPQKNINGLDITILSKKIKPVNDKIYLIIQFEAIPTEVEKQAMVNDGIKLLEYIPSKAYVCEITSTLSLEVLKKNKARAIILADSALKTDPALSELFDKNTDSEEEVLVAFYSSFDYNIGIGLLKNQGFITASDQYKEYNIVQLQIPLSRLAELASIPFVQYIEKVPPPPVELNFNSRNLVKANVVQSALPDGYNLSGEGVVIGINEVIGLPQEHIDFADRLLPGQTGVGYHSTHVHGIVAGKGLINELYKGYAPNAFLYSPGFLSTSSTPLINKQFGYGIVLTNNSYATGSICGSGIYTATQYFNDKQAIDYPFIQHVFATGNSGAVNCNNNYPAGFNTVHSGAQNNAKSSLSVGSIDKDGRLSSFSSKGPAGGGKIKPEIVSPGALVISTVPVNTYGNNSGTSMATPAVTGGMALMYQRYKQLHAGVNPSAALMKAILCNTATDAGNTGPDYSYGFGKMDLLRCIQAIDSNHYFFDSVTHQATITKTIQVLPGISQLKVLLYWQDPPASLLSNGALVNELDLTLVSPSGTIHLPYTLDTTAANVANPATRREDHVNNIEQVVIDNPVPGNYQLKIKGTEIGQNPDQPFFVTYDQLPDNVQLTFPFGGEALVPGETITIQWDSWGENNSTFTLAFSPDNGLNWQNISSSIASDKRQFDWQVPNINTINALLRLTRNADSKINTSKQFTIIGTPPISLSIDQCPGSISLQWNAIPGADQYEIMRVSNGEMITVATTTATSYIFRNLSEDSVYWVTVRSIVNNKPGRRAVAISRKPNNGNCINPVFDNDLKADTLISPFTGREFTSTALSNNEEIVLRIKNLDNQPAANYTASYSINNGNWVSENISTPIAPASAYTYHFLTKYNFSLPGIYLIKIAVTNQSVDLNKNNDTIKLTIRQLLNSPVNLSASLVEKFNQAPFSTYNKSFLGIPGIDRFDYVKAGSIGYINFPSNSMSDSSGKSLLLGLINTDFTFPPEHQSVISTYNFSAYDTSVTNINLSFVYSCNTSCGNCPDRSKIWIRGDDTKPWVEVMLMNNGITAFSNRHIEGVNLSRLLSEAGQNFSSSFQIKWSHSSSMSTYLFDDIDFFDASNDISLVQIDSIAAKSCNLGIIPLKIKVRNLSRNPASNVPVHYKINNGSVITETIPFIAADSTLSYTFNRLADMSTYGYETIEAWVSYPSDMHPQNDIKKITLRNQPLVNQFPYLENFETSNGFYYTEGINSSWQYGRPSATFINQPASGNAAWKTNLNGKHNINETSYLYSPCFDYSTVQNPVISISLALNIDSCGLFCDFLRPQYSTDGITWNPLGSSAFQYNWSGNWSSKKYYRWHVASNAVPANQTKIQFRYLFRSDDVNTNEGAGIDDIHIYERKNPIYDTTLSGTPITKTITGGNIWTEFLQSQKIIASINPYGQNLGNTILLPAIKPVKPVSNFHGQYYLNRSFSITTENKNLTDSIGIRLYYLDSEADSLLFTGNCINCSKPADAYRFGISQYSTDSLSEENDNISDNITGKWSFIENRKVKIVPYDKGYYAEFKVKDLSEFRLNNGGPNQQSYLPVNLINFSATKSANATTDLNWTIASEINIRRYEIEIAKGNDAFANSQFTRLGEVTSPGPTIQNRSYNLKDISPNKYGVLYYRLKIIDEFGNSSYSKAVPVLYSKELNWKIFPNPSDGYFTLLYQLNNGERATVNIYNAVGQMIKSQIIAGNGFIQKMGIDMTNLPLQRGMYLVKVLTENNNEVLKLVLQ